MIAASALLVLAAFAAGDDPVPERFDFHAIGKPAEGNDAAGVLAKVDGREVRAPDLVSLLFLSQTQVVFAALEQAVRRELVRSEAERAGITVGASALDVAVAKVLKQQDDDFKLAAGPEQDLERYLEDRYGTTPRAYRAIVRQQVIEELFLARVIRYEFQQVDRGRLRLIVLDDRDAANTVREKLKEGANFAALAKQQSIDPSGKQGGLFPPLPLDCPHPLVKDAARLKVGETSDVGEADIGGHHVYWIARLEEKLPADTRPYSEQAAAIDKELEARPIDPFEHLEWDRRVRERHAVEIRLGRS